MKDQRQVSITLSGINDPILNDGKMNCQCVYLYTGEEQNIQDEETYEHLLEPSGRNLKSNSPIILNYKPEDKKYHLTKEIGPYFRSSKYNNFVFYKREYQKFHKFNGYIQQNGQKMPQYIDYVVKGEWKPVNIDGDEKEFRDYNVKNGHSYQYIAYPRNLATNNRQQFANQSDQDLETKTGDPVKINWNCWSITELIPLKVSKKTPLVAHEYKVDSNNIWLFKYNLDVGSQIQNINKNEIQTLGRYPRYSQGLTNNISGEVTCMLGSEIIPNTKLGYIERRRESLAVPLSTNEKVMLLNKWRKLVYSRNPKLLKDQKGQAWIVQIVSSSNTPNNIVMDQPDSISFAWKEIESIDNTIIYGDGKSVDPDYNCFINWHSIN